jgi:hypothetical protein
VAATAAARSRGRCYRRQPTGGAIGGGRRGCYRRPLLHAASVSATCGGGLCNKGSGGLCYMRRPCLLLAASMSATCGGGLCYLWRPLLHVAWWRSHLHVTPVFSTWRRCRLHSASVSSTHSCQRTGSSGSRNGITERGSTCWRTRIGQGYTSLVRQVGSGIAIHFCLD